MILLGAYLAVVSSYFGIVETFNSNIVRYHEGHYASYKLEVRNVSS